jgi:hypothetical protein
MVQLYIYNIGISMPAEVLFFLGEILPIFDKEIGELCFFLV